jgi:membrane protein DedA with SNARE-associated domain
VSAHAIAHLVREYGLLLVFAAVALQAVGAPVPGTTAVVAAALYAATARGLPIAGVIGAAILGALTGTTLGFLVGRRGGERLLLAVARRLRISPARVQALRRELDAHGTPWLLVARFVTGLRNIAGLMAGASGMPLRRFLAVSTLAAALWATINALEYYWFGRALIGLPTWLQVLLVVLGLLATVLTLRWLRRRSSHRVPLPDAAEGGVR